MGDGGNDGIGDESGLNISHATLLLGGALSLVSSRASGISWRLLPSGAVDWERRARERGCGWTRFTCRVTCPGVPTNAHPTKSQAAVAGIVERAVDRWDKRRCEELSGGEGRKRRTLDSWTHWFIWSKNEYNRKWPMELENRAPTRRAFVC